MVRLVDDVLLIAGATVVVLFVVAIVTTATAILVFGNRRHQSFSCPIAFIGSRDRPHSGCQFHLAGYYEVNRRPLHIGPGVAITMKSSGPCGPPLPPLGSTLKDEVQDQHDDDGEDDDGRRPKAQDVFHL